MQIEFRIVDTATAAVPAIAIVPVSLIVIDTMETITTVDIQMIESTMIGIKAIAAATKIIVTSDQWIKAIGMCPLSIHAIG